MQLPVIFRKLKNGQVVALFPTLPAPAGGDDAIKAYTQAGRETQVDTSIMYVSKEATAEEYKELLIEVVKAYPMKSVVIQHRITEKLNEQRRENRAVVATFQAA